MDPERLEREQPDFVGYLREAHGHVYGPEYWKTYVRQIASLWLTPLRYTYEDLAAVTDPVLILVGDRDGACTAEGPELFRLLYDAELAVAPGSDHSFIEAKAGLFDALALDFLLGIRAIDQPEVKTVTFPAASREKPRCLLSELQDR